MGYVAGSSLLPQYLHHSLSPPSSCSCSSQSTLCFVKNAVTKGKSRATVASLRQDDRGDAMFSQRRVFLFVGLSVLPSLRLRARAIEDLAKSEESGLKTTEENQKAEQALQRGSSSNPILSLLNGLGIFTAGMLGALYALAQKEKKASDATIESITKKLKEKETSVVVLEKDFESKLLKQEEEKLKQLRKEKEEQQNLINRLNSASSVITGLGQELKNEKRIIGDLKVQFESSQDKLAEAGEEKKTVEKKLKEKLDFIGGLEDKLKLLASELKEKEDSIQNLSSALAEKELELENLSSTHEQTKNDLVEADNEIKGLRDELVNNRKELESKNSTAEELNAMVNSLTVERDECKKRFDTLLKEYSNLESKSKKNAAYSANIIGEMESEVNQLKERLDFALNEVSGNQAAISDLTQERDDLRQMLDLELSNVNNLKEELQITQDSLGKSRNEASDLTKQLKQSKDLCRELEADISKVKAEFAEARQTLQKSLNDEKRSGEVLARELTVTNELLKKTTGDLQVLSHELNAAAEERANLQKELVDAYKKAETAATDLKVEKNTVSSLSKEFQALEKQVLKDKESRKSLEADLEEATKSLDEMNRNALTLSKELDTAFSQISSLEDEKEVLYRTLTERKNASKEAQENMEDAHNLVMRLGTERDTLLKKTKKLEDELASAKGEILRLRSRVNSSKVPVNDQPAGKSQVSSSKALVNNDKLPGKGEAESKVTVTARRNSRRRKTGSESDSV
ncbi:hypothetical protein HS088_TW22G00579 [Tripterygium wilfordii]|uniref:MAR-binding filament-like protein 1-1 n=1 Tax=Tripterygium wilfordii TaxID=458696 RepID=A0A7J7BYF4_TRIWF|nr:MAR-binding filament-like protein 1-1 [Tripterygium wilfordii]KAF5726894.1 hypothetical protein HS088_TW22G00579 [Tripterygium wilfordii]